LVFTMKIKLIVAFIVFMVLFINSRSNAQDVVINEIFYDPGNTGIGCFVELYGKSGLSLDGYRLVGVNGADGKEYNQIALSGKRIQLTGYFVIAEDKSVPNADIVDPKVDYQNGPDNIELWNKDGKIDAIGYGDFEKAKFTGEGTPTLDLSGYSIGRRKDGFDSNDNSVDFVGLAILSPGRPNWPGVAVERKGKLTSIWGFIKKN